MMHNFFTEVTVWRISTSTKHYKLYLIFNSCILHYLIVIFFSCFCPYLLAKCCNLVQWIICLYECHTDQTMTGTERKSKIGNQYWTHAFECYFLKAVHRDKKESVVSLKKHQLQTELRIIRNKSGLKCSGFSGKHLMSDLLQRDGSRTFDLPGVIAENTDLCFQKSGTTSNKYC